MDTWNVSQCGQEWWDHATKKMKNAIVYMDSVSCECLHWNGGAASVFEAGAVALREFSTFEVVPKTAKKAVFVANGPFHGARYEVLKSLIKRSSLEYCVIITTANSAVHDILRGSKENNDGESFHIMEEDVLKWMGNMNYTVEIFNYPVSMVHPTRECFLLPSARPASPFLSSDLTFINEQLMQSQNKADGMTVRCINDVQYWHLPLNSQCQIRQLVSNLNQILQHMNAKEEIYTVGSYSRVVGAELEALNSARTRRKNGSLKVSVIVVDRVLDLVSATKFSSQTLFDRFMHRLDRFHETSSDVAFAIDDSATKTDFTRAPGSLAPESDWQEGWDRMEQLILQPAGEAAQKIIGDVKRIVPVADGVDQVEDILKRAFNDDWQLIEKHTHLYQVATAISRADGRSRSQRMQHLEAIQKELCLCFEDKQSPSPLVQILQIMKAKKETGVTLEDILVLMVHIYSLSGDEENFSSELEDRFKSLLAENLVGESDHLSEQLQDFVGVPIDDVKAHRAAQKIMEHLHAISKCRNNLKRYGSLQRRIIPSAPLQYNHFFHQLIDDIFNPDVVDNPDVEAKSGGLRDLLKTGFRFFFVNDYLRFLLDSADLLLFSSIFQFVCERTEAETLRQSGFIFLCVRWDPPG